MLEFMKSGEIRDGLIDEIIESGIDFENLMLKLAIKNIRLLL